MKADTGLGSGAKISICRLGWGVDMMGHSTYDFCGSAMLSFSFSGHTGVENGGEWRRWNGDSEDVCCNSDSSRQPVVFAENSLLPSNVSR